MRNQFAVAGRHGAARARLNVGVLQLFLDAIPQPIFIKDDKLRFVALNRSMAEFLGHSRDRILGRTAHDRLLQGHPAAVDTGDGHVLESGEPDTNEVFVRDADGGSRTVLMRKQRACLPNGSRFLIGSVVDIGELKARAESSRLLFESSRLPMWVYDIKALRFLAVNQAAIDHYGYSRERFLAMSVLDIIPDDELDDFNAASSDETSGDERIWKHIRADGSLISIAAYCQLVQFEGAASWMVAIVDVTEREQAAARIAHLAHHDSLTGLPNRQAFTERLNATLECASPASEQFAVLCLDLDRFKEVNDVFGHAAGDFLLQEMAKRLTAAANGAFLSRIGGDEFTMIVEGRPVADVARRLMETVEDDIEFGQRRLRVGLSIGVATFPKDGLDATTLLNNADAALYRAKAEGRGLLRFFEPDMDRRVRDRRALQSDLQLALSRHELSLAYQPQALTSGEAVGFEALLRWNHSRQGPIPPTAFIPLAEESGLIIPIGEWVLRESCREAASWPNQLQISVNLSPVQFRHGDLPQAIHQILLETGLSPARLEIEITESVLFDDLPRASSILRRIKSLGVRIAMDDFGTGYSSLSYLQAFPFDKIKIDRSFTARIGDNPQSQAIIRAIIGLGRGLSMNVVAEGVETRDQLELLKRENCDQVQGYLIGRPQPIEAFAVQTGLAQRAHARAVQTRLAPRRVS